MPAESTGSVTSPPLAAFRLSTSRSSQIAATPADQGRHEEEAHDAQQHARRARPWRARSKVT